MTTPRASLVLVLVLALAGCTGGAPPATTSAMATPGTSPPTMAPSPAAPSTPPPIAPPQVTPAPSPTPRPTAVRDVPKPTGVTFRESTACLLGEDPEDGGCRYPDEADDPDGTVPTIEVTRTVTWRAPRKEGVEIRVYAVAECVSMPASPKPGTSGPCLAEHTLIPKSALVLLATAPASAGKASWTWRGQEPGCDIWYPVGWTPDGSFERPYYAVVVAAYDASGRPLSIFAIATAAGWSVLPEPKPGEVSMPC